MPLHFSFMFPDKEYLLAFLALLMVAMVIVRLVAIGRKRAHALLEREAETASLYRLSRDLAAASSHQALYAAVVRNAETSIAVQAAIFHMADHITAPAAASSGMDFTDAELASIDWTCKHAQRSLVPAEAGAETGNLVCIPLMQGGLCIGVLALRGALPGSNSQRLVEGIIAQTASALQRIELSHQAEQAQLLKTRADFERALINSISHDLRTPLATITGALSILREKQERFQDHNLADLLETACSEAARLNAFVGNLLDMIRIEAGAINMNSEPCELQELVGCALISLEQRIGTRQVRVVLPEDLPLVMIDQALMTQVLVNLLDNALKYSPPESAISISAYSDSSWVVLEVADRGPGIPEQDLLRVFDRFYRIPVREGATGTGLGLSICKGIVEAHGGMIEARNRPGGGMQMLVWLPVGVTEP
jgi:two-component system sensor histidine kinase KdpD